MVNEVLTMRNAGGKHYSRNLRPLDADGNEISMWSEGAQKQHASSEDDSSEDEDEDEDEDEEEEGVSSNQTQALSRQDRKKEKAARKAAAIAKAKGQDVQVGDLPPSDSEESDDDMPANPNHSQAARKQATAVDETAQGIKDLSVGTPSRREREAVEAQKAKEAYQKLHDAGKTDQAKADMARLRAIREKREADAALRQVRA
jgi:hypothetical protein